MSTRTPRSRAATYGSHGFPLTLWLLLWAAFAGAACGPTELPAFANPPPYDAGAMPDEADAGPRASR